MKYLKTHFLIGILCLSTVVFGANDFVISYDFSTNLDASLSGASVATYATAIVGGTKLTPIGVQDDNGTQAYVSHISNNNNTSYAQTFMQFDIHPKDGYIVKVNAIKVTQRSSIAGVPGQSQTYLYRIGCAMNGTKPVNSNAQQSTENRIFYDTYATDTFEPGADFSTASGSQYISAFLTARGKATSNDEFDWFVDKVEIIGSAIKVLELPEFSILYSFTDGSKSAVVSGTNQLIASDLLAKATEEQVSANGLYWIKTNDNTNSIGYDLMGLYCDITPSSGYEVVLKNYTLQHAASGIEGESRANRLGIYRDVLRSAPGVNVAKIGFSTFTGRDVYGDNVSNQQFQTTEVEDVFTFNRKHYFTFSFNRVGSPALPEYWTVRSVNINGWIVPEGRGNLLATLVKGQKLLLNAKVGTEAGEYKLAIVDDLQDLLSTANDSLNNSNTSTNTIHSFTTLVSNAVLAFPLKANKVLATLSVDTLSGHPLVEGMSGYNSRLADSGWSFLNPEWQQAMDTLNAGWLRYMSGTRNNGFNMNIGLYETEDLDQLIESGTSESGNIICHQRVEVKGPQTVYDLYQGLGNKNARLVVTWSGFIGEPWEAALFAKFCKDNHIEVDLWQFANEPYFFTPGRDAFFWNDGEDFARKMHPIADSIKTYFPNAILAPNASWDDANSSFSKGIASYQPRFFNAISKHTYAAYNTNGGASLEQGIKELVGGVYYTGTEVHPLIEQTYGVDFPVYVTESGTWNTATSSIIMSGIYMSEYILRMSEHSNTRMVAKHSLNSAASPIDNHASEIDNAYTNNTPLNVDNLVCGIKLTAEGMAQRVINGGINLCNYRFSSAITGDVTVEADNKHTKVTEVPALFGGVYQGSNGKRYILMTNKSDIAHELKISGITLPEEVMITYISSTSPFITNNEMEEKSKTVKSANLIIEPYSINRIEWMDKVMAPSASRIYDTKIALGEVSLKWWTKDNADSYVIQYGTSPETLTQSMEVSGKNTNTATVSQLASGSTYYFTVSGKNASGMSLPSNIVDARIARPDAPTLVSAFGRTSTRQNGIITLLWRSVPYAHGYKIKYGLSANDLNMEIDARNCSGFRLPNLAIDKDYFVQIVAYNGIGESSTSNILTANTTSLRPVAPHQVKVSENKNNGKITIQWENSLAYNFNAKFNIYRSTKPYTDYELVASNIEGTSYIDQPGLAPGRYFYTVKATNAKAESYYPSNKSTIWKTVNSVGLHHVNSSESGISVYPNPANHYIHIQLPANLNSAEYALYNLPGKKVQAGTLTKSNVIDITNISTGIYIFKLSSANGEFQTKLKIE